MVPNSSYIMCVSRGDWGAANIPKALVVPEKAKVEEVGEGMET